MAAAALLDVLGKVAHRVQLLDDGFGGQRQLQTAAGEVQPPAAPLHDLEAKAVLGTP
jgi:hypothetical protein